MLRKRQKREDCNSGTSCRAEKIVRLDCGNSSLTMQMYTINLALHLFLITLRHLLRTQSHATKVASINNLLYHLHQGL